MIDRDLLALFARPAMRRNPDSWLQWFGDRQLVGIDCAAGPGRTLTMRARVSFNTATVGIAPAWAVR